MSINVRSERIAEVLIAKLLLFTIGSHYVWDYLKAKAAQAVQILRFRLLAISIYQFSCLKQSIILITIPPSSLLSCTTRKDDEKVPSALLPSMSQ
jgi:hypothetical protein